MKILMVDDNREDRKILRHYIERFGHTAVEAENGEAGLKMAAEFLPDLIISDALMPVMDGFQFLRQIKKDPLLKNIPFVFYSAVYQGEKDIELAMNIGAEAYIIKPKEPEEFWEELNRVMKKDFSAKTDPEADIGEETYLRRYSHVVVSKLEDKVKELEALILERTQMAKALEKEKEKAQKYFDIVGVVLLVLGPDQVVLQINRKGCELLGREKEWIIGRNWKEFLPIAHHKRWQKRMDALIKGVTDKVENVRIPVLDDTGAEKLIHWNHCILKDETGRSIATVSSGEDITERTQARKDRKTIEKRLQAAHKMESLGTLAGGIAHDFNNILSAIIGYTELAKMKLENNIDVASALDEVLRAGNRARNLVRQILAFSRQTDIVLGPVHMRSIVDEVLQLIRASFPSTITIQSHIKSDARVMGDATSLHQVILNLCTNAGHAMKQSGGVLSVSLKNVRVDTELTEYYPDIKPGSYVKLSVCDTGHGMSEDVIKRIFDPFYTTKEKGEGTGMGLSVVHGIVKSLDGAVDAYSELDKGSTFNVYLPLCERRQKPEQRPVMDEKGGTERILFIDDDLALASMGKTLLEGLGYSVEAFTDGEEALAYLKEHAWEFDIIISDMTMPGIDGEDLAERCRSIRPDIPIVIATGFSVDISRERAGSTGVNTYIMKPILKYELARTIRRILDMAEHPLIG